MPYVKPVAPGETTSMAHQPLSLPRTKHRKRAESVASNSTATALDDASHHGDKLSVSAEGKRGSLPDFGAAVNLNSAHLPTEDVPTPRAGSTPPLTYVHSTSTSHRSNSILDTQSRVITASPLQEDLTSQLAATSLESNPGSRSRSPSLSYSHHQSPASTSITSLSEQGEGDGEGVVEAGGSSSSSRRGSARAQPLYLDDDEEQEGKVRGEGEEEEVSPPTTLNSTPSPRLQLELGDAEIEAIMRYRQSLLDYTRALYVQAKLSNSRAEKRRQSMSNPQFGLKQSGMEKMAAKKALARRLNG